MKIKLNVELDNLGFNSKEEVVNWLEGLIASEERLCTMSKEVALRNREKERKKKERALNRVEVDKINADKLYKLIKNHLKRNKLYAVTTADIISIASELGSHMTVRTYLKTLVLNGKLKHGGRKYGLAD